MPKMKISSIIIVNISIDSLRDEEVAMLESDKYKIAQCLIQSVESKVPVDKITCEFIYTWIKYCTDRDKDCLDIWEIVLNNYYPTTRPILFRATDTINNGKIESYTGRLLMAERMLRQCDENATLIICDTRDTIYEKVNERKGSYRHTFFPLVEVLKNESMLEKSLFTKRFLEEYTGEDEYIMKTEIERFSVYKHIDCGDED